ncbi:Uncharacterised protein [Candidatus Tiddalikarchaeum anstoanum]|nr:Uncharacterised protein [Candidatus Tiddalikarchaeum anstoanum]
MVSEKLINCLDNVLKLSWKIERGIHKSENAARYSVDFAFWRNFRGAARAYSKIERKINKLGVKYYTQQDIQDCIDHIKYDKYLLSPAGLFLSVLINKTKEKLIELQANGSDIDFFAFKLNNKNLTIEDYNGECMGINAKDSKIFFKTRNTGTCIGKSSNNTTLVFENNKACYIGEDAKNLTVLTPNLNSDSAYHLDDDSRLYYLTADNTAISPNCIKIPEQISPEQVIKPETFTTEKNLNGDEYKIVHNAIININGSVYEISDKIIQPLIPSSAIQSIDNNGRTKEFENVADIYSVTAPKRKGFKFKIQL